MARALKSTQRGTSSAAQDKNQLAARMSVFIDKSGIVRLVDMNIYIDTHGADMLTKIRSLGLER